MKKENRNQERKIRHRRIKGVILGTENKPRVSIYKSLKHIYIQIINDKNGKTLAAVNDLQLKSQDRKKAPLQKSSILADNLASKAKKVGIKKVVFDRSGYPYMGIIKNIAQVLREKGLKL